MKLLSLFSFTLLCSINLFGQWTQLNSGTTENLNSVYFTDINTGYVAGAGATTATILKTTDGGINWFPLSISSVYEIKSIFFSSANTGYALNSHNELFKTINAGTTWTFQKSFWGYDGPVYFTSPQVGFLGLSDGNKGIIHRTIDGGNTWIDSSIITGMSNITAIHFPQTSIGYAVSFGGKVAKTIDGGATWQELTQPTSKPLIDVYFTQKDTGYAVGGDGLSSIILKTINGGSSWSVQTTTPPTTTSHNAVYFTNSNTGYLGNVVIYQTINGGNNWNNR